MRLLELRSNFTSPFQKKTLLNSFIKPLSVNPTKWSNPLKQFIGCRRQTV